MGERDGKIRIDVTSACGWNNIERLIHNVIPFSTLDKQEKSKLLSQVILRDTNCEVIFCLLILCHSHLVQMSLYAFAAINSVFKCNTSWSSVVQCPVVHCYKSSEVFLLKLYQFNSPGRAALNESRLVYYPKI